MAFKKMLSEFRPFLNFLHYFAEWRTWNVLSGHLIEIIFQSKIFPIFGSKFFYGLFKKYVFSKISGSKNYWVILSHSFFCDNCVWHSIGKTTMANFGVFYTTSQIGEPGIFLNSHLLWNFLSVKNFVKSFWLQNIGFPKTNVILSHSVCFTTCAWRSCVMWT